MPSLDTSALVRWLVEDDDDQAARVHKLLESALIRQATGFVPSTVLLELEFKAEAALERAPHLYRPGAAESADCPHAGLCWAANRTPLVSFDKKASRLGGIQLLDS